MTSKTKVAIILDKSGSMDSIRKEIVDAFNEQVKTIKANAKDVPTRVSLVTFGTEANEPLLWDVHTYKLKPLELDAYYPFGMTAMYDAVGYTCNRLAKDDDGDTSYLIIIISDGYENNSKNYTMKQIASMTKELQDTKRWTFTYIGANQDLTKVSKDLNIPLDNTIVFACCAAGVGKVSDTTNHALNSYYTSRRAGETQCKNFFDRDDSS
jgi:uncharacterized protein with von Willebrand factor type A (vWA) domain